MGELKTLLNHIKGGIRERESVSSTIKNLSSKLHLKYINLEEVKEILDDASRKVLKLSFEISKPMQELQKGGEEEDELKKAVRETKEALQQNSLSQMAKCKEKLEELLTRNMDPMVKVGLRDWIKELEAKMQED
jgi:DNA-binding transcriptional MerR regulator